MDFMLFYFTDSVDYNLRNRKKAQGKKEKHAIG